MKIGNKIKKLRELRNLTQEYVAKQLEMTQAGYSRMERDEVDISVAKLEQISKVLHLKLEEILGFDEAKIFGNQLNNYHNITNGFVVYDEEHIKELKKQYEVRLIEKDKEIERLHSLLEKALTK